MVTQTELDFRAGAGGKSQNARLAQIFHAHPCEWLSMTDLGRAIGAWAVHSRVADLRRKFGMTIASRSRVTIWGTRHSEYRYEPSSATLEQT